MYKINLYLATAGKTLLTGETIGVGVAILSCNGNSKRVTAMANNSSKAIVAVLTEALKQVKGDAVISFWTDNSYVRSMVTLVNAWQEKGWTTSKGLPCKNVSDLEKFHAALNQPCIKGTKVVQVSHEQLKDVYRIAHDLLPVEEQFENTGCAF